MKMRKVIRDGRLFVQAVDDDEKKVLCETEMDIPIPVVQQPEYELDELAQVIIDKMNNKRLSKKAKKLIGAALIGAGMFGAYKLGKHRSREGAK